MKILNNDSAAGAPNAVLPKSGIRRRKRKTTKRSKRKTNNEEAQIEDFQMEELLVSCFLFPDDQR